jgi:hypothetical protein
MLTLSHSRSIGYHGFSAFIRLLFVALVALMVCAGLYLLTLPANPTPKVDSNALWREDIQALPKPLPPPSRRTDHPQLAQQAIKSAQCLCQNYTFRLIVFAWKRRASLKRLLDSLSNVDYHGFTVHLDFHMDGGPHQKVVEFVDSYEWAHGRIRINHHAERVGLERVHFTIRSFH